jgi:hypothetical protein
VNLRSLKSLVACLVLAAGVLVAPAGSFAAPDGVDPSLKNNDILACTQVQGQLKSVRDLSQMKGISVGSGSGSITAALLTSIASQRMSPRISRVIKNVAAEFASYPVKKTSLAKYRKRVQETLSKVSPWLSSACSHVSTGNR